MKPKKQIRLDTTRDFKALVGHERFKVTYRKDNGRLRKADAQLGVLRDSTGRRLVHGTLDPGIKDLENERGEVRYFDHGKDGYRKFKLHRMVTLEILGKKYSFGM